MSDHTIPDALPPAVIDAFASSAVTALRELAGTEAFPSDAPMASATFSGNSVWAVVRLVRPVPGTMTLILTADDASWLAERYLPTGTELTDEIVNDVTGEFANVIAGQAKTILKGTPYHFGLSIPVVARGKRLADPASFAESNRSASGLQTVSVVFESGQLWLRIELLPCADA